MRFALSGSWPRNQRSFVPVKEASRTLPTFSAQDSDPPSLSISSSACGAEEVSFYSMALRTTWSLLSRAIIWAQVVICSACSTLRNKHPIADVVPVLGNGLDQPLITRRIIVLWPVTIGFLRPCRRALKSRGHQSVSPEISKIHCYSKLTIALPDAHRGVTKCTRATPEGIRPKTALQALRGKFISTPAFLR